MNNPRNDFKKHMAKKVGKAADDYRESRRRLAVNLVNAVLDAQEAGISREQILADILAGPDAGEVRLS